MNQILMGLVGIVAILAVAVALSGNRRAIRLRVVGAAFLLQAGLAALVLYVPAGRAAIGATAHGVDVLLGFSRAGANMVFGGLDKVNGVASFAFNVLPIIVFFAALVGVLNYYGVLQLIVKYVGGFLQWVIGIDKVEGLYAAANILVGQSESPLMVRGYLRGLSDAQLFALMTTGMAGVAGSTLAAYAQLGVKTEYLLAAAFMSAPGGLLMAKLIMPDPVKPTYDAEQRAEAAETHEKAENLIMAIFNGAEDGVKLAVSVGAMLVVFVSLVAMADGVLGGLGGMFGHPELSFERILGWMFSPLMYLLAVPKSEMGIAGQLFGQKVVLNEFIAYLSFAPIQHTLSAHTQAVISFALCGFANLSSIAIQLGVLGGLVPGKRPVLARFGVRAVMAGSLSNLMSAALAGLMLSFSGIS
ncbi:MAG: nucleoside transporter C-terminal domain-containing protein [Caulobacteraceae bacterium]